MARQHLYIGMGSWAFIHQVVRHLTTKSCETWSCKWWNKGLDLSCLKFDRCLSSSAVEAPVKFHNDMIILTSNLVAMRSYRPWQNGHHFADDILKHIFWNECVRLSIKISLNIVPGHSIDNKAALVQIMACCWTSNNVSFIFFDIASVTICQCLRDNVLLSLHGIAYDCLLQNFIYGFDETMAYFVNVLKIKCNDFILKWLCGTYDDIFSQCFEITLLVSV